MIGARNFTTQPCNGPAETDPEKIPEYLIVSASGDENDVWLKRLQKQAMDIGMKATFSKRDYPLPRMDSSEIFRLVRRLLHND